MRAPSSLARCCAALALLALASCLRKSDFLLPQRSLSAAPDHATYTRTDSRTGAVVLLWEQLDYPDGRELKHGVERRWYPSRARRSERWFEHGEPTGTWLSWYEDGTLRSEYTYDPEGEPTLMRFYHPSGALSAEGLARRGQREGEWRFWHPSGALRQRGAYAGGAREGTWTLWNEDGSPRSTGRYANDARVGPWLHGPAAAEALRGSAREP